MSSPKSIEEALFCCKRLFKSCQEIVSSQDIGYKNTLFTGGSYCFLIYVRGLTSQFPIEIHTRKEPFWLSIYFYTTDVMRDVPYPLFK